MTPFLLLLLAATGDAPAEFGWTEATPIAAQAAPAPAAPARYDTPPGGPAPAPRATTPLAPAPLAPAPLASAPVAPAPPLGKPPRSDFDARLSALELALSTVVVESPTLWRFDRLEDEAAALLGQATNQTQRAAVRGVAARIDRFVAIASQHRRARESADGWRRANTPPRQQVAANRSTSNAADRVAPPVRLTKAPSDSRFDAEGRLRPVVSQRPDAPKYAVVDDEGRLAALVTPTPENERRFEQLLGKRVGLSGRRGYLTDLRREHVVAERVTPLDTMRR